MKNIAIYLFFSNPPTSEILGTLNVNRRYGCMQVNSDFTTEAIRNYAKNLTRFEICYNRTLPNDLMSLFGEMTALEGLEFYNCKLSEEKVSLINNQEQHRTLLPNLKTIQIKNTSSMVRKTVNMIVGYLHRKNDFFKSNGFPNLKKSLFSVHI